jgi:hypothetical protein
LETNIHEPPITMGLSKEQLEHFQVPKVPNNTQCVEFFVQEVNKQTLQVSTDDARNANVLINDYSRKNRENHAKKVFDLPNNANALIKHYFPQIKNN